MAAVSFAVPERLAEALGSLAEPLEIDEVALESILRLRLDRLAHTVGALSEGDFDSSATARFRESVDQLLAIADLLDAMAGRGRLEAVA